MSSKSSSLVRSVSRTSLAGIALGVAALVIVISVMTGFHDSIRRRLLAAEPHLVIEPLATDLKEEPTELIKKIRDKGYRAEWIEKRDLILRTSAGLFGGAEARGVSSATLQKMILLDEQSDSSQPQTMTSESVRVDSETIVMGSELAHNLDLFIGDRASVLSPETLLLPMGEVPHFQKVTLRSILTTNVSEIDSRRIYYVKEDGFPGLTKDASVRYEIEVWLNDVTSNVSDVKRELEALTQGFKIETWEERNSTLFQALKLEILSIGLFLSLSTMVAGFSIVTVLLILLAQKRKEIGVLMALGLSRKRTERLFTHLGVLLASLGVFIGVFFGVIVCLLIQNQKSSWLPDIYYDTSLPARINFGFVASIVIVAVGFAFFASWLPARRVSELEPSEAMRGSSSSLS